MSAVASTRFTCIPVYMLSNNHIIKLCITSLTFCAQDAVGKEIKQMKYVMRAGDLSGNVNIYS